MSLFLLNFLRIASSHLQLFFFWGGFEGHDIFRFFFVCHVPSMYREPSTFYNYHVLEIIFETKVFNNKTLQVPNARVSHYTEN